MHGSVHKDEMESQCAYRQASLLERFLQLHRVQLGNVLERKKGPGGKLEKSAPYFIDYTR